MIYTDMTKIAINLAFKAHENQMGKDGLPYICHPLHIAEQMTDEISTCVAILHDTIEDTNLTIDNIKTAGLPDEVCEALQLLTHEKYQPYIEYVQNLAQNDIARRVKIADLEHNMDESRVKINNEKEKVALIRRRKKYEKAYALLTNQKS